MAALRMASAIATGLTATTWLGAVGARSVWSRFAASSSAGTPVVLDSLANVLQAEPRIWRGPTPSPAAYDELAARGVGLIVDLRAEADSHAVASRVDAAGMDLLMLPTVNGGVPLAAHLDEFHAYHRAHAAISYVHCEAGEGRTGAIVGAHQVRAGRAVTPVLNEQLAVGSLTIAQMAYIATQGRRSGLCSAIDLTIDRPTEKLFDLVR